MPDRMTLDRPRLADLAEAKTEWSNRLLSPAVGTSFVALSRSAPSLPSTNVVGVGIGEKLDGEKPTGVLAIKFLVRKKYPKEHLSRGDLLPASIHGLPVDVEEVGLLRALAPRRRSKSQASSAAGSPNPRKRYRPAQPGASIGFADPSQQFVMAGTFGARASARGKWFFLSNNHVLADENRLPLGSPIFQPGLLDHGNAANDKVGELVKFVPLKASGFNKVDCALAEAISKTVISDSILQIGVPSGVAEAAVDMIVQKFGRTTGYTAGRVTSINTDVKISYDTGQFLFRRQIIVVGISDRPFSDSGDSGSLILERSSARAVGLLFAGSKTHTIANHIGQVLTALGVRLG